MASQLRRVISNKVIEALDRSSLGLNNINSTNLISHIKVVERYNKYGFAVSWNHLKCFTNLNTSQSLTSRETDDTLLCVAENVDKGELLMNVGGFQDRFGMPCLGFNVCTNHLCESVLIPVIQNPKEFWKSSDLLQMPRNKVLVTFGSPYINRAGSVSHLRGSILAKFIANVNEAMGHEVILQNQIDDWGINYSFIKYAYDSKESYDESKLKESNLSNLMDLYSWTAKRSSDTNIKNSSREILLQMESGDEEQIKIWKIIKDIMIKDLKCFHEMIDLNIDEISHISSQTSSQIDKLINLLKEKNIVKVDENGRTQYELESGKTKLISESDGIFTATAQNLSMMVDNYERHSFDVNYRVCPVRDLMIQKNALKMVKSLEFNWADKVKLIEFGQINDLSIKDTKSYTCHLEHIVNYLMKMIKDPARHYRKPPVLCDEKNVKTMALTGFIISDQMNRRSANYKFKYFEFLKVKMETGAALQTLHAELTGLLPNGDVLKNDVDFTILMKSKAAYNLILQIARFDEVLLRCYENVQPCNLTEYLFHINKWSIELIKEVKRNKSSTTAAHFILISATRNVLGTGMEILGVQPINKL